MHEATAMNELIQKWKEYQIYLSGFGRISSPPTFVDFINWLEENQDES